MSLDFFSLVFAFYYVLLLIVGFSFIYSICCLPSVLCYHYTYVRKYRFLFTLVVLLLGNIMSPLSMSVVDRHNKHPTF